MSAAVAAWRGRQRVTRGQHSQSVCKKTTTLQVKLSGSGSLMICCSFSWIFFFFVHKLLKYEDDSWHSCFCSGNKMPHQMSWWRRQRGWRVGGGGLRRASERAMEQLDSNDRTRKEGKMFRIWPSQAKCFPCSVDFGNWPCGRCRDAPATNTQRQKL